MRWAGPLIASTAFAIMAVGPGAWAHTAPVAEQSVAGLPLDASHISAPVTPTAPDRLRPMVVALFDLVALSLMIGSTALAARTPRRTLALLLVVILAVFAFETGVHSVHHLTRQPQSNRCAMAWAGTNATGLEPQAVDIGSGPAPTLLRIVPIEPSCSVSRGASSRTDGRAPPLALVLA